jgi:hypothetical protein
MSALADAPTLFDSTPTLFDSAPSVFDEVAGEPTLDDLLSGSWEGLTAHKSVACPMCGDAMTPVYSAHALPTGGKCGSCGTQLS